MAFYGLCICPWHYMYLLPTLFASPGVVVVGSIHCTQRQRLPCTGQTVTSPTRPSQSTPHRITSHHSTAHHSTRRHQRPHRASSACSCSFSSSSSSSPPSSSSSSPSSSIVLLIFTDTSISLYPIAHHGGRSPECCCSSRCPQYAPPAPSQLSSCTPLIHSPQPDPQEPRPPPAATPASANRKLPPPRSATTSRSRPHPAPSTSLTSNQRPPVKCRLTMPSRARRPAQRKWGSSKDTVGSKPVSRPPRLTE